MDDDKTDIKTNRNNREERGFLVISVKPRERILIEPNIIIAISRNTPELISVAIKADGRTVRRERT